MFYSWERSLHFKPWLEESHKNSTMTFFQCDFITCTTQSVEPVWSLTRRGRVFPINRHNITAQHFSYLGLLWHVRHPTGENILPIPHQLLLVWIEQNWLMCQPLHFHLVTGAQHSSDITRVLTISSLYTIMHTIKSI